MSLKTNKVYNFFLIIFWLETIIHIIIYIHICTYSTSISVKNIYLNIRSVYFLFPNIYSNIRSSIFRWTNIFRYSFGHSSFTEYIRIFVRHKFSLTNIFGYSFGQKNDIRYTLSHCRHQYIQPN